MLKNSGNWTKLQCPQQKKNDENKKKIKNNIILFGSPYRKSIETNTEWIFIKLFSKAFPPNHKFVSISSKVQ